MYAIKTRKEDKNALGPGTIVVCCLSEKGVADIPFLSSQLGAEFAVDSPPIAEKEFRRPSTLTLSQRIYGTNMVASASSLSGIVSFLYLSSPCASNFEYLETS